jgi:hypothetical protein
MWGRIASPQCAAALQDRRYHTEAFPPGSMGGDAFLPGRECLKSSKPAICMDIRSSFP